MGSAWSEDFFDMVKVEVFILKVLIACFDVAQTVKTCKQMSVCGGRSIRQQELFYFCQGLREER